MPFKNDFFWILMDFGTENGAKLVPKSCQKSMLTSNGRFSRKPTKNNGFSLIFVKFGTQVGSQNALKIDPKIYSKIKCVLASIFLDFGRFWEASWGRNGSKNRCKNASKKRCKFRCVLDVSWVGPGGWGNRRAMVPQRSWDPLIDNSQRKAQSTVHRTQNTEN